MLKNKMKTFLLNKKKKEINTTKHKNVKRNILYFNNFCHYNFISINQNFNAYIYIYTLNYNVMFFLLHLLIFYIKKIFYLKSRFHVKIFLIIIKTCSVEDFFFYLKKIFY